MLGITAGLSKKSKGVRYVSSFFFLCCCRQCFLFPLSFQCTCFDCLNITFLTRLQGYGLEEGTDPCVFNTQLTKLLNLIALLGVILFCGNLTLFFDLCFYFCFIDKNVVEM